MSNVNNILSSMTKKQKIIAWWFLLLCWIAWVSLSILSKNWTLNQILNQWQNEIISQTWSVSWTWEIDNNSSINEKNNLYTYKINKEWEEAKEYSFRTWKDWWTNILLWWLKTSAWHENNILALISVNPEKEKIVYSIFDPRVRFDDWSVNPQELRIWTSIVDGLQKDLGIEIQYFWTLTSDWIGWLVRTFVDKDSPLYANWINVWVSYIKDNATWFDLLTKNKGSQDNHEIIKNFLNETTFDHVRNRFEQTIFDLFWKEWVWNNFTKQELEALWKLIEKSWISIKYSKEFNLFTVNKESWFYDINQFKNEDWSITNYWALSQKTIDIIQNSLK